MLCVLMFYGFVRCLFPIRFVYALAKRLFVNLHGIAGQFRHVVTLQ